MQSFGHHGFANLCKLAILCQDQGSFALGGLSFAPASEKNVRLMTDKNYSVKQRERQKAKTMNETREQSHIPNNKVQDNVAASKDICREWTVPKTSADFWYHCRARGGLGSSAFSDCAVKKDLFEAVLQIRKKVLLKHVQVASLAGLGRTFEKVVFGYG